MGKPCTSKKIILICQYSLTLNDIGKTVKYINYNRYVYKLHIHIILIIVDI